MINELTHWFSERPKWLQIAADRLLERGELSDGDISELTSLCRQEADGVLSQTSCSFPASAFSQGSAGTLRLCAVSDIVGVNALAPKKPIEFGKGNITVVYGSNGSGKSGYVRLLKHVCGARDIGTIYGNVYKSNSTEQKAVIAYEKNGNVKRYIWSGQGICDDLNSVDIFDTTFGRFFINVEDEVSYEPPILSFFSSLIEVCEKVASELDIEANRHQSKKPNMPLDKKATDEGIWYDSISSKTTRKEIDKYCSFDSNGETEIQNLQLRLTEQDPVEKAKQLKKRKQHIDVLIQDAQKYLEQLSDENCQRIITAKKESIFKKSIAEVAAEKVFEGSHFEGIGSDVWKELWVAARKYSISFAYKGFDYPNLSGESRCVLCHQILTQEAKERLVAFETFVKGELQCAATEAANEYNKILQTLDDTPNLESLKTRIDATGLQKDDFICQATEFFAQLQARKEQLLGVDSMEEIPFLPQNPSWLDEANIYSKSLGEMAAKYDEDAMNDNRHELKKKLDSLQARKWLSENRAAIEEEICRLNLLAKIQEARKLTNTKALSQKKGDLAEVIISDAFVKRFNRELKALGASQVKVELIKTKVSKGRVLHKLQLRDASRNSLTDILSEGENRIVSIAAFLADITGKNSHDPIIFDDPISSLDQTYEEVVVKRLIDLSLDKQIIVFTHRLSLLGTVRHYTEKKSIKTEIISIRSMDWGTGEPAPLPLSQSEIKSALNILIDRRYQDVKKANENSEFELAEILLKSICSDFRALIERSIENDLLCGVVQRFQRPVSTLKLKELTKLKDEDCKLLDSLMTKYSGFEHSQPEESPIELPQPDDLLADMVRLKEWREEYLKRKTEIGGN